MDRAYFALCLALGRLLRSARYSTAESSGPDRVLKRRRAYAGFLIWLSRPFTWLLDTGVRILPQREWELRERMLYRTLYGMSITTRPDAALLLPRLPGRTLAAVLEDLPGDDARRSHAITLAVLALARFHQTGETHGDAMAENVLVDTDAGVAHWFDFETVHTSTRSMTWRRADDLRALMTTCAIRVPPDRRTWVSQLVLETYGDAAVARAMRAQWTPVWRRSLSFHLAQSPMAFDEFRDLGES